MHAQARDTLIISVKHTVLGSHQTAGDKDTKTPQERRALASSMGVAAVLGRVADTRQKQRISAQHSIQVNSKTVCVTSPLTVRSMDDSTVGRGRSEVRLERE
ncbi:hypothetical protein ColLi_00330 [Colletotrichum liriopes]|uniref:Uncharacterized protein n=1 Tax=Colletotrichum liriopes TaxID=708192 RepID=A0AA37GBG5_9PEZI|nr:hypothetical protein ColLi_00330 [Colletotrichum liriopes]